MSSTEAKSEVEEAVNTILDTVGTKLADKPEAAKEMYQLILGSLRTSNERLWFGTSLRLGQIYLAAKNT